MLPVVAALCALSLVGCERRDLPTVDRNLDPVVLTGDDLPGLVGAATDRVVAFRFVYGTWVQVPVQVDERAMVDLGAIKHGGDTGVTAALPNPGAVGPIKTILSWYLFTGILPVMTS